MSEASRSRSRSRSYSKNDESLSIKSKSLLESSSEENFQRNKISRHRNRRSEKVNKEREFRKNR